MTPDKTKTQGQEPKQEKRNCPTHGDYLYPRWARCELCPAPVPAPAPPDPSPEVVKLVEAYGESVRDLHTLSYPTKGDINCAYATIEATKAALLAEFTRLSKAQAPEALDLETIGISIENQLWFIRGAAAERGTSFGKAVESLDLIAKKLRAVTPKGTEPPARPWKEFPDVIYLDRTTRRWYTPGESNEHGPIEKTGLRYKANGAIPVEPLPDTLEGK